MLLRLEILSFKDDDVPFTASPLASKEESSSMDDSSNVALFSAAIDARFREDLLLSTASPLCPALAAIDLLIPLVIRPFIVGSFGCFNKGDVLWNSYGSA